MSLKEELDRLREAHEGVEDLIYADISSQMVLYASSREARSQEIYDSLLSRAQQLLAADGPAAQVAQTIGADTTDALMIDGDGSIVRLFVRAGANAEECLIFGCEPGTDVSAISRAAAETLTRFASSEG